jgi:hypothetical protein
VKTSLKMIWTGLVSLKLWERFAGAPAGRFVPTDGGLRVKTRKEAQMKTQLSKPARSLGKQEMICHTISR